MKGSEAMKKIKIDVKECEIYENKGNFAGGNNPLILCKLNDGLFDSNFPVMRLAERIGMVEYFQNPKKPVVKAIIVEIVDQFNMFSCYEKEDIAYLKSTLLSTYFSEFENGEDIFIKDKTKEIPLSKKVSVEKRSPSILMELPFCREVVIE